MARDIRDWLEGLGLGSYAEAFEENAIAPHLLSSLTDQDLREIGVTKLGHRKELLNAIAALLAQDTVEGVTPEPQVSAPAQFEAERRQLTVMFVDLEGSTVLSGQLDPEDLRELMRRYQDAVAGAVTRYGGHVAKYLGDGVLAYFGWPQAYEDQAERAVHAGLDAVAAVADLSIDGGALGARAGIATGQVVVGDLVGAAGGDLGAVSGETPNLAARLQDVAGTGGVAVSDTTKRLIGETFELEDLGATVLKGFAEPVPVWRAVRKAAAESRFEAAHPGRLADLVGRKHEIGMLLERWQQAKGGEGQVVLLSGEAGIGKSRITQELRERVAAEPHTRVRFQCSPYYASTALHPFIVQLERAAGFVIEEGPEAKLDKLEGLLALSTESVATVAPVIADLLSVRAGGRYSSLEHTPQRLKELTQEVLTEQLLGLAARQPVLMIFEDAHWADPTSLEVLERMFDRVQAAPVMAVVTFRPDFRPPWHGHTHVTALTLSRLGHDQCAAMVANVTGGKALPKEVQEQIIAKTDGIPLFVEELTKTVVGSGLLEMSDDRYELTGPLPQLAIPSTLKDSLMARLDRYASVKKVAQIGAAIGREFSFQLLAAVSHMDENALLGALDQLVEAELVFRRGTTPHTYFVFKHALVQDSAYESLLKSSRQELHRDIARALEEGFPETAENEPEIVAHHFTEAGLAEKAIEYWRRAGERASGRSANVEAEVHLKRGLSLCDQLSEGPRGDQAKLDLHILLGPVLMMSQGWASSEIGELYTRADELCQRLDDRERAFTVAWGLWLNRQQRAEFETAIDIADRLLGIARQEDNEEHLLQAHHSAWTSRFAFDELDSVIAHTETGLRLYDKVRHRSHSIHYGGHDPGVCCRLIGGMVRLISGLPTQGRSLTVDSVELARELNHPFSLALALSFSATSHLFLGEVEEVAARMEEVSQIVDIHSFAPIKPNLEMLHGWARIAVDGDGSGIQAMEDGLAQLEKTGLKRLSFQLAILADGFRRLGSTEAAISAVERAITVVEDTNERRWEAEIYRLKGDLLAVSVDGGTAEGEASYLHAVRVARGQGAKWFELRAATGLARLWRDAGRNDEARKLLAPLFGWFTEGFDTPDLKVARALLGELS